MVGHVRNAHPSSVDQLPILIEMSERPIDEGEVLACPLCPGKLSLRKLQNYLAGYLEGVSLFVLPNEADENHNADSDKAAMTRSKLDQEQDEAA